MSTPKWLRKFKLTTFLLFLTAILVPVLAVSAVAIYTVNAQVETVLEHNLLQHARAAEQMYAAHLNDAVIRIQVPLSAGYFTSLLTEDNHSECVSYSRISGAGSKLTSSLSSIQPGK